MTVRVCWLLLVLVALPLRGQISPRSGPGAAKMSGLAQQAMIDLPAPPAWDKAPMKTWTIEDIEAEFAKVTHAPPQVNSVRTQFRQPSHDWMNRFKKWFLSLEKPLKLRFENQLWDCDDYANCFVAFADLLALRAGEAGGTFCVGWARVYYQRPFAGIRSGAHAVVIVGTSQGLFVIEPQNGTMVSLREFPNRHTIETVFF